MKRLILFIAALIVLNNVMYAQEDSSKFRYPFNILVTATRISTPLKNLPFATTIVTDEQLNATLSKTISVNEALKLVPGVKIDDQADGPRVHLSIRGQGILSERGIRGIKFLMDGLPLNDPAGFTPDLYDVDWGNISKIEVLRGPSASIFGGSSSGGIVNIRTMDGPKQNLNGGFSATYGTFNFWKALGDFGGTVKDADYKVTLSRMMGDGYRTHTHYWGNNLYGKANYHGVKGLTLTPVMYYTESYSENAEGLNLSQYQSDPKQSNPDAVPKNEYLYTQRFATGVSGEYAITNEHSLLFNAFVRRTAFKESVPSTVTNRIYLTPGGSLQYIGSFGNNDLKHTVSIGGDIQFQKIDQTGRANLGGGVEDYTSLQSDETINQRGIGVFATYKLDFAKYWSATASGRYDNIHYKLDDNYRIPADLSDTKDFDRVTGRFGLTFTPLPNLNIYANVGTGFVPPSVEELANNPDNFGGFNKNLVEAKSTGTEIGLRGDCMKGKIYYELTGYYLHTSNDFDRFRVPWRPSETFYRNTDSLGNSLGSNRIGAELYLKIKPVEQLTFQVAYTLSEFKYDITVPERIIMDDITNVKYIQDKNFLPNSPEHQAYFDLQYNIIPELFIGVGSEVYSRSYIDGANIEAESVPGFALFNARLGYNTTLFDHDCQISLFAKNIFDRKWVAFTEPDPGGNSYQPGAPFEIFGTVSFRFK